MRGRDELPAGAVDYSNEELAGMARNISPADHEALWAENERLRRERDGWKASSAMYEATAAEGARGIDALEEIDAAWDAFGTRGNRNVLTLAEQIASLEREVEAAEARLADAERRIATAAEDERDRLYAKAISPSGRSIAVLLLQEDGAMHPEARTRLRAADPSRSSASDEGDAGA